MTAVAPYGDVIRAERSPRCGESFAWNSNRSPPEISREVLHMFNADEVFVEVIQLMEQAKNKIEFMRAAKAEEVIDGRSLSIAVTHLETSQLWVANARK